MILASLECVQLVVVRLKEQSTSLDSFPVQPTVLREMGPLPWPNAAPDCAVASASEELQFLTRQMVKFGKEENNMFSLHVWEKKR